MSISKSRKEIASTDILTSSRTRWKHHPLLVKLEMTSNGESVHPVIRNCSSRTTAICCEHHWNHHYQHDNQWPLQVCFNPPFSPLLREKRGEKHAAGQTASGWCVIRRHPVLWYCCPPLHSSHSIARTQKDKTILPPFIQAPAQLPTWKIPAQHVQSQLEAQDKCKETDTTRLSPISFQVLNYSSTSLCLAMRLGVLFPDSAQNLSLGWWLPSRLPNCPSSLTPASPDNSLVIQHVTQ